MDEFNPDIELFIKDFVGQIASGTAAVFAGAGLSRGAGYVDWKGLLKNVAKELRLDLTVENDLIAMAQYHVNARKGHGALAKEILEQFSEMAEETPTHQILARLPITTWWTTNYDKLIEQSLISAFRVPDVKDAPGQLSDTKPRRSAVVYKMHGDVDRPNDAILYKAQYERYFRTHEAFITALSGDLTTKTFLFIGFSFTDPNLDYVLSRLPQGMNRQHYCFVKRPARTDFSDDASFDYATRREALRNDDLQRYGIKALELDSYDEIPVILRAIERLYRMRTVFISGSAEEYGEWTRAAASDFVHNLSAALVQKGFRVVTGFGWGVGSAVINGALQAIYERPDRYSEDQLIMRPFPQVSSGGVDRERLWREYRERMIALAGVALFVFGNKVVDGKVVDAEGVRTEFNIARDLGLVTIPLSSTGYMAEKLAAEISADDALPSKLREVVGRLRDAGDNSQELIRIIVSHMEGLLK
jgi:hypothetical protein